jgi:hypothetical protein
MSNMSYCRFRNTLTDLYDCHRAMAEYLDIDQMDLSEEEMQAMKLLIKLCKQIAEENEE